MLFLPISHTLGAMQSRVCLLLVALWVPLSLSLAPTRVFAQELELPPEIVREVNRGIEQGVNAITLFTSQDSVSSGSFEIDGEDGESGSDFSVNRLPLVRLLGQKGDEFRPRFEVVVGHFGAQSSGATGLDPTDATDFQRVSAWSFSGAAGVEWRATESLTLTPMFNVIYTHLKRRYDYNNPFSQTILRLFDREIFNTSIDLITYNPSLAARYKLISGKTGIVFGAKYAHLFNSSESSKSRIIDVDSDSGLLQTAVEVTAPLGVSLADMPVEARPYIVRSDIYGDARKGLGLSYFHELGFDFLLDLAQVSEFAKTLSVGGSYSFGESLTGWRVGVGLAF